MTPQTPPTDRPLTAGDVLYERAKVFATRDKASTSYLQRRLQIVYNQAAGMIERMQAEGLISAPNHAGMRTILVPYIDRPATSATSEATTQACVDWDEYTDDIADVISDSLEMDWTSSDGARAVVRWLNENAPFKAQGDRK